MDTGTSNADSSRCISSAEQCQNLGWNPKSSPSLSLSVVALSSCCFNVERSKFGLMRIISFGDSSEMLGWSSGSSAGGGTGGTGSNVGMVESDDSCCAPSDSISSERPGGDSGRVCRDTSVSDDVDELPGCRRGLYLQPFSRVCGALVELPKRHFSQDQ